MTSRTTRRTVLGSAAASGLAFSALRAWSAPAAGANLLVIFLRGAYDPLSAVPPISSSFYYEARPNIAIARPAPADGRSARSLDADWGLHPSLADPLLPLWTRGQLAFAPFTGTDDLSRSHFETQDAIELGFGAGAPHDFGSGFMARLAAQLGAARPIAFTEQVPLAFRGPVAVPNISVAAAPRAPVDAHDAALIRSMYAGGRLAGSVDQGFDIREEALKVEGSDAGQAGRKAASAKGFELSARRMARLMRDGRNLAFADVGGWDTHVGQGGADGYLADRLGELGRGLAAFADEMGDAWGKTVVVSISEFGRTFRENGDRGTDHGHGSTYWILGGALRGGRMVGEQTRLTRETLNQDRDLPVLNDYRALIGDIAGRALGLSASRISAVFPGSPSRSFGLV